MNTSLFGGIASTAQNARLLGRNIALGLYPDKEKCFRFPLDATISISGRNELSERIINKDIMSGVVVEQWARGLYDITIAGVLIDDQFVVSNSTGRLNSLDYYVSTLAALLTTKNALYVHANDTGLLGIDQVAIKSWSFPFTQGFQNQDFEIRAISCDPQILLTLESDVLPAYQSPFFRSDDPADTSALA